MLTAKRNVEIDTAPRKIAPINIVFTAELTEGQEKRFLETVGGAIDRALSKVQADATCATDPESGARTITVAAEDDAAFEAKLATNAAATAKRQQEAEDRKRRLVENSGGTYVPPKPKE